jgi:hypothetical protein
MKFAKGGGAEHDAKGNGSARRSEKDEMMKTFTAAGELYKKHEKAGAKYITGFSKDIKTVTVSQFCLDIEGIL